MELLEKSNRNEQRLFIVALACVISIVIIGVTAFVTVNTMHRRGLETVEGMHQELKQLSVEQWNAYMDQDYYYPDITQTQEVEVND